MDKTQPNAKPRTKAIRAVKRSWYDLRHRAIEGGLIPAQRDYTRFLIVASARTGSTMLTRALNDHSQIEAYGEIVRRPDLFPARFVEFGRTNELFANDPARFLESRVFHKYPPAIGAVGFKIFYFHAAMDTEWGRSVWAYLEEQPALKVIHLQRRNLLRVEVSRQKAARTKEWISYSADKQQQAVVLDYDQMVARFDEMAAWQAQTAERFAGHELTNVYYEELAGDYENEIARIQSFLGVDYEPVRPPTAKRPKQPLAEQIANYSEIKAQLAGTPWAAFLDE